MSLPRPPQRSAPIPNQPFDYPEVTSIRGPYWNMPIGTGLEFDGSDSIQLTGSEPTEPLAYMYGAYGFIGMGTGLTFESGDLTAESLLAEGDEASKLNQRTKKLNRKRARNNLGQFLGDDPSTPENEAWVTA